MTSLNTTIRYFALAFSALLPVINPLGSALVFLGVVGNAPTPVIHTLARKIAVNTLLFLIVVEATGALLLRFFGISLPVMQVAGGLVLASMGWHLLNQEEAGVRRDIGPTDIGLLERKIFYPLTFPVTAGPGTVVVLLTLSARASVEGALPDSLAHIGILLAIVALCVLVFVSYAYAPKITERLSPQTAHGILRIIAFVLLCIGVQITWNGAQTMLRTVLR